MNRSRSTLSLIELSIMLLVLALSSALCLRAFAGAADIAQNSAELDRAVVCAQNAAETLKRHAGQLDAAEEYSLSRIDGGWELYYDEDWARCNESGEFVLRVTVEDTGSPLFGRARITVERADGKEIFSIPAAWQEVGS